MLWNVQIPHGYNDIKTMEKTMFSSKTAKIQYNLYLETTQGK